MQIFVFLAKNGPRGNAENTKEAFPIFAISAFFCGYSVWLRRKPRWVHPHSSDVEFRGKFTIFGVPGATYSIQATTNLAPAVWIEVQRLLEGGPTLMVTGLSNSAPQQFYRAEQVGP